MRQRVQSGSCAVAWALQMSVRGLVYVEVARSVPQPLLNVTVDPSNISDHVSDHMYGSGMETYEQQMYGGLWSNMLFDDSIEDAAVGPLQGSTGSWFSAGGTCAVAGGGDAMNGNQSLQLGSGCVAVNRGLVVHGSPRTSMHFVGGKEYEGYLFARVKTVATASATTLQVSLLCAPVGEPIDPSNNSSWSALATTELSMAPSTDRSIVDTNPWVMHNFTLTPSTDCLQGGTGKALGQGLISIALVSSSSATDAATGVATGDGVVGVDKIMVEPGTWGRYEGMHVRRDLAEAFLGQKPTMMRLGGSMTNTDGFRFKYAKQQHNVYDNWSSTRDLLRVQVHGWTFVVSSTYRLTLDTSH